jgi:hypothetical protein
MELYSPKAKKADTFRKNTIRKPDEIMVNRKGNSTGSTIIFELKEEKKEKVIPKPKKKNLFISMGDFLKLRFYERMKVFFESEGKDEYSREINLIDEL